MRRLTGDIYKFIQSNDGKINNTLFNMYLRLDEYEDLELTPREIGEMLLDRQQIQAKQPTRCGECMFWQASEKEEQGSCSIFVRRSDMFKDELLPASFYCGLGARREMPAAARGEAG